MIATFAEFSREARHALADHARRQRIRDYSERHRDSLKTTSSQYSDVELARKRAAKLRWHVINHLDKYLIEFESKVIRNGGKVIWAQDQNEAIQSIAALLRRKNVPAVVTRSNAITGNLSASPVWEQEQVKAVEADFGHYILQQEEASHNIIPALHKTSDEVAESVFSTGELSDTSPARLAHHIKRQLRHALINSNASVNAAQFIVADTGAAVLCDDEGSTMFTTGLSRTSIIIAGIETMVSTMKDLDLLLSLYATYSSGKSLKTYNTVVSGPKQATEQSGPEELYIVLVDNGKSDVLAYEHQRQVLSCISCGACLSASSIYKVIGGKVYAGPAQSVAAPVAGNAAQYRYLADLATLDGSGSELCPVKINFSRLVLRNRNYFVQQGLNPGNEKWFYFAWKKAMLKRDLMNWAGVKARNKILENYFRSKEGLRIMPPSATKTFNQMWRERMGFN